MSVVETPGPAIRVPELRSGVKLIGLQRDEFLFRDSRYPTDESGGARQS